ncbi:MAG: SRPBCC family protein [Planctomycetes bacterium]|nr:SRPBCC family protein [Planctomycetota bacterium]
MSREFELRRVQTLPLPPEEVFEFFADARNLEAITPPFLKFRVLTEGAIEMRPGALIEYRLQLFGVPFGWRTEIESYDPPRSFVDRQLRGPYALWHHTHTFKPITDEAGVAVATEMTDVVRYRIRFGVLGSLARLLFVRRTLDRIFDYRAQKIDEVLTRHRRLPRDLSASAG